MPEFRQNPLTGAWVVIAPDRAKRPDAFKDAPGPSEPPPAPDHVCPFCPGNERQTPDEVFAFRFDRSQPDTPGWTVRVFPNKFPAVVLDAGGVPTPESIAFAPQTPADAPRVARPGSSLTAGEPGVGHHEVLVDSPAHDVAFHQQGDRQAALILEALRHRFRMLLQTRDVKYVAIFKNHGRAAGASLPHPHFQIVATAVVPPAAATMIQRQEAYAKEHGRALFDALLEEELELSRRVIAANDEFVALAPWASQAPYETWIVPREPVAFLGDVSDESLPLLAAILRDALQRLAAKLPDPAFNLVIHNGPRMLRAADHHRLFVQILPRLEGPAGLELGTGIFINSVAPEQAAAELRGAL